MRVAPGDREDIAAALSPELGDYPADEIGAMIWLESAWDPAARNAHTSAAGLIQIMPYHLKRWGMTVAQVVGMTALEQMPLIIRFFREAGAWGRWKRPGDTYLAVAAPAMLGKPDDAVAYPQGSKAWKANKGWRPADGGAITAGSIREVLLRQLERGTWLDPHSGRAKPPAKPKPTQPAGLPWEWLLAAGVAWLLTRRR